MSWEDPFLLSLCRFAGSQDGEAGVGGHGQGHVAVPAVVAADLVIVQTHSCLAVWKHSSTAHLLPATEMSSSSVVSAGSRRCRGRLNWLDH